MMSVGDLSPPHFPAEEMGIASMIRTHAEMHKIFEQRAAKGLAYPIVHEYVNETQALIFFGSLHSNHPNNNQWQILEDRWNKFMAQPNHKKVIIHESHISPNDFAERSRDAAILANSDSGFSVWLAVQTDVSAESGEPSKVEEIEHLKKFYSNAEIMTYYFARQMAWMVQDVRAIPDWRAYADCAVENYNSLGVWGEQFTLDRVLGWYEEITGKQFDLLDKSKLYALSDPTQSQVSSASGRFRDEHLLSRIQQKWQTGYDVFVVYGAGHAITLEPALEELTNEAGSEV